MTLKIDIHSYPHSALQNVVCR